MLSDDALDEVYRVQPIYFWESSYKSLVPDLRYLPLIDPADIRAQRMVNWLLKGVTGLQTMQGVSAPQVVSDSGTLTVKFTGEGPAPDPDGLRRMLFQLQWTLRPPGSGSPNVRLVIDDKPQEVPAGADEYQSANRSWNFRQTSPPRYDVTGDNKVVANPGGANPLPVLAGAENQAVFAAAVGRGGAVAAFVRTDNNSTRRSLQIVREGGGVLDTALKGSSILRPVFVPDSNDSVLVISGGRLWAVSGADGSVNDVTRGGSTVTSVSVSSDGRRVAFVADGQAYVSSLGVANSTITINTPRPVLSGQIAAKSVTWLSESRLAVAGSTPGGPALWRVTADGVVAQNLSESLKGVVVDDLVAYPTYPAKTSVDVLVTTPQGVYSLLNTLAPEAGLRAPFFGS
jgi:hypothetical protein